MSSPFQRAPGCICETHGSELLPLIWNWFDKGFQAHCFLVGSCLGCVSCCCCFARGMADGRDGMLGAPITDLPSWHGSLDLGRNLVVCNRPQCGPGKVGQ